MSSKSYKTSYLSTLKDLTKVNSLFSEQNKELIELVFLFFFDLTKVNSLFSEQKVFLSKLHFLTNILS